MNTTRWRKSSRSNANGECVELAHTLDRVRDSKNPYGPALTIDLVTMLAAIKSGHLDD